MLDKYIVAVGKINKSSMFLLSNRMIVKAKRSSK